MIFCNKAFAHFAHFAKKQRKSIHIWPSGGECGTIFTKENKKKAWGIATNHNQMYICSKASCLLKVRKVSTWRKAKRSREA